MKMSDKTFQKKASKKGFEVDPELDNPTGVECPRPDCDKIVVYNGNYFCACGWACPPPESRLTTEQKRYIARLIHGLWEYRRNKENEKVRTIKNGN
jgi:hypothetical protein